MPISILALLFADVTSSPTEASAGSSKNLREIVPALTPEGWELYDEVLHLGPENLYQLIDGRAELYLSYDVIELTYAAFDCKTNKELSIDLSVYDMGTALNAFGVFSVERSAEEPSVELGRSAYRSGSNFYVWKGPYYVQVIASGTGEALPRVTRDLARSLVNRLVDNGEKIWGLTAFPLQDLVENSVRYFRVDALGMEYMQKTFTALYRKKGRNVTAFLSNRGSEEVVQNVLQKYAAFGDRYGDEIERSLIEGIEFLICDMRGGYDVVCTKGPLLIGVSGAEDRATALELAATVYYHCSLHE